jgi:hypothetical protein
VTPTEHTAKSASTPKTGLLATLGAFLHAGGTGAPSSGGARLALLSVLALCVIALTTTPAPALALNPERHYEMVSPEYKEGYGISGGEVTAVEPGGESVAFKSRGGFAGALSGGVYASHDYLARRGPSGWSTVALEPAFGALSDVSANLEYALAAGPVGPNAGVGNDTATEQVFQLHRSDAPNTPASWEVFGGIVMKRLDEKHLQATEQGASPDLCHVVVGRAQAALLPVAENTPGEGEIYDLSRGCGAEPPSLRLIGLNNSEAPAPINRNCLVFLGAGEPTNRVTGNAEQKSTFNAVDAGGDQIFFTTNLEAGSCAGQAPDLQLFVRLDGRRTVEVSRPLEAGSFGGCASKGVPGEVPCDGALARASAYFKGASEDGSKVFFTTAAPLVSGDENNTDDLYMATIGCPGVEPASAQSCQPSQREVTSLVQVSHAPVAHEAAEVQGMVSLSADGSHMYFVAHGVLSSGANAQGQAPVKGADNLYVYDSGSHGTAFIAELCSGPAHSGAAEDVRCPRDLQEGGGDASLLWRALEAPYAQSTGDGAFLVFSSYAQLLPGDTDQAKDVYRYDAQTGALDRVSLGEEGHDANGNNNAFDANIRPASIHALVAAQHALGTRAITEDGSRIVFSTAEPLSPDVHNTGVTNVYEWHEGSVSLISSGTAEESDSGATITPSGRDIMFITSQGLVPQDTDGLSDIYDARLGDGFPPAPAERLRCSGDACQGSLTNPAALLVPGSVSQAPGGNFAAPAPTTTLKPKAKPVKCKKGFVKKKGKCAKKPKARKAGNNRRVK